MLGCHVHAKNTLDLNYLALAERNGAETFALHEATSIEPLPERGYRVSFKRFELSSQAFETAAVTGQSVVVAAGSLGSTELLLRCRDVYHTLKNISPKLGENFSGNGDALIPTTRNLPREIDAARGPSITVGVDCSTAANKIYVQDLGIPDPFFWYLQAALPVPTRLRSLWVVLREYVLRVFGKGRHPLRVEFERLFDGDVIRALPYLGMGSDDADGKMRLVDGSIDIIWDRHSSRGMFAEMESALKTLSQTLNGQYRASPLANWPMRKLLTAHPLGGCPMSDRREDGVVNEFGEVWNYPGLYVSDGSIIPTALAINPSATISALAERIASHMVGQ
jgi:cholesterol oxidase